MLSAASRAQAQERLAGMVGPVTLRVPAADAETTALAEVLTAHHELLQQETSEGESLTLLDGYGRETGIHFLGAPLGQEFGALLDAILTVSRGASALSPLARAQAEALPAGTQLAIFTTPT